MSSKNGTKFYHRTDVKLTLWYIFTFFLSVLLIFGFLYLRLKHQLIKEIDRILHDEANELSEILAQGPKGMDVLGDFENTVTARTYYPIYFRIFKKDGSLLYVSKNFDEIGYKNSDNVMAQVTQGKETLEEVKPPGRRRRFRVVSIRMSREGKPNYVVQVGTHTRFVRKSLSHFKGNLLGAFPIILVLGSLGGWVLARRSLAPVGYIASKARSITSTNLDERLATRGTDDEMDDLIRTINEMIARLENSFKRVAEFTADASHELKTPICALRGEAEVLLSKKRPVEEYQEGLANFIDRFDQLNRMINDLILLSKCDSSQVELKMTLLRLDLVAQDIGNLFKILAEQKGIDLRMGRIQEVTIVGDKVRLQQLFTNLIDNAIKYTSEGSIRITVEKDEKNAVVKVVDTGIGIPPAEQENIFKRFYRVDKSRSKEGGGVGLGLSIVEWIVHAHRGRIEVDSELNRGSTFTVYLPIPKNSTSSPKN
jgi:heavy metal sensor kinase